MSSDVVTELLALPTPSLSRAFNVRASEVYAADITRRTHFVRNLQLRIAPDSSTWSLFRSSSAPSENATIFSIIASVFMASKGAEVTALKVALDSFDGSMKHDFKTLFYALDDGTQMRMRSHIEVEGRRAIHEWNATRKTERIHLDGENNWHPVKLYADYDDTMQVRLFDHSYPNGQIYPGVSAFMLALQGRVPDTFSVPEGMPSLISLASVLNADDDVRAMFSLDAAEHDVHLASSSLLSPPGVIRQRRQPSSGTPDVTTVTSPDIDKAVEEAFTFADPSLAAELQGTDTAEDRLRQQTTEVSIISESLSPESEVTPAMWSAPIPTAATASSVGAVPSGSIIRRITSEPRPTDRAAASGGIVAGKPPTAPLRIHASASPRGSSKSFSKRFLRQTSDGLFSPVAADSPVGHRDISGLVYISARPNVMKRGTLNNATSLLGVSPQAILCGTIMTSLSNKAMADKKVENFTRYHPLFPEYRAVWLGDSGQGDILAGEMMMQWHDKQVSITPPPHAPRPLVLIHDICHSSQIPYNDSATRVAYAERGIYLFDSYVEAAVVAFEHGILSARGLRFVIESTAQDLKRVVFTSVKQKQARLAEFHAAIRAAHAALEHAHTSAELP